MDLKQIRALIKVAKDEGLAEVEYQKGSERIRVRLPAADGTALVAAAPAPPVLSPSPQSAATSPAQPIKPVHTVLSPFVGTFYRSPSPGTQSFVEMGSLVKRGQVLCIVEAMKLMNEIESDCEGRVTDILVANGEAVEYGEALFRVDPLAARA